MDVEGDRSEDVLSLIHLDVSHIIEYYSSKVASNESKYRQNKRQFKRNNELGIEDLKYSEISRRISDRNTSKGKENNTSQDWITLSDREITICTLSPVDLAVFEDLLKNNAFIGKEEDGRYTLRLQDIKITIESEGCLLTVKNNATFKFKPKLLFSVNVADATTQLPQVLPQELSLVYLSSSKRQKNAILPSSPTVDLRFNINTNRIDVNIKYQIKSKCNLFNYLESDVSNKVMKIIEDSCDRIPTIYERDVRSFCDVNEAVSPHLFYKSICDYTSMLPKVERDFEIPELETKLLKFQSKTVNWLLEKEGMCYDFTSDRCTQKPVINDALKHMIESYFEGNEVDIDELDNSIIQLLEKFSFGWSRVGRKSNLLFFNKYIGNLLDRDYILKFFKRDLYNEKTSSYFPAQGLLAEEMGLGKTVEITALVLMNARPIEQINEPINIQLQSFGDFKTVTKSKTTLIIAPDSILRQWVEEINHLAPSLAVTIYRGVNKYPKLNNKADLIAEYLKNFDVVFATYSTISKELDYALYSSKNRSTRNAKKRSFNYSEYDDPQEPQEDDIDDDSKNSKDTLFDNEFQSLFQLTLQTKKPRMANAKSNENDKETDYEKALQDEIEFVMRHNKTASLLRSNDYQSPLMLLQFWRVVLDEVQMVSSKISRAFQSAALIPRFHAWGVSGTPIKKTFFDLHSILLFLKYQPFCYENSKNSWSLLSNSSINTDFIRLWTSVCLRHTKAMVHDDIKLPPQDRVLLKIPFSAVEQENYNQLFEDCLSTICLDGDGNPVTSDWEATPTILAFMRSWLVKLRQICGNPQVGKLNLSSRKYRSKSSHSNRGVNLITQLKTLENVLNDMLNNAANQLFDHERQFIQLYVETGSFYEYILNPQKALKFLNKGALETERIIFRLQKIVEKYLMEYKNRKRKLNLPADDVDSIDIDDDNDAFLEGNSGDEELENIAGKIRNTKIRLKSWYITLHKFYFLIASSYFQHYDPEYLEKINNMRNESVLSVPELEVIARDDGYEISNELISMVYDIKFDSSSFPKSEHELLMLKKGSLSNNELQGLEQEYYRMSDMTRQLILKSSIKNVEKVVRTRILLREKFSTSLMVDNGKVLLPKSSKRLFNSIPMIEISDFTNFTISIQLRLYFERVQNMISQLNQQTGTINSWMEELLSILTSPLVSHDKSPDGEEYEKSITDQDKVSCYLHILGKTLLDRTQAVTGPENSEKTVIIKKSEGDGELIEELKTINDVKFLESLNQTRLKIKPKMRYSFQDLVLELKEMEVEVKNVTGHFDSSNVILKQYEDLSQQLRNIFDNQKVATVLMQRELNLHCNSVFNARIDYFKQLQQISDSVKAAIYPFTQEEMKNIDLATYFNKYTAKLTFLRTQINKAIAKYRYLKSLTRLDDQNENEEELMCIICQSSITIGSLTQCGHKYCKDCLDVWLKSNGTCPMCKSIIYSSSVYNFTYHRPNLQMDEIKEEVQEYPENKDLYSIYHPVQTNVTENIESIQLGNSYSSKVDMIVRLIIYLRNQDSSVQIVIFSQWQDLLYIIGTALSSANITYVGSYGTLTPDTALNRRKSKFESVEEFKNSSSIITCFLLNAKAQASGLTLINASHIFLCEPLVNTSLELQAISRIHRIGQTKRTTVWMFAIQNTVEENIVLMSTKKRLQYMDSEDKKENKNGLTSISEILSKEKSLTQAESITLMNSAGTDTLISRSNGEGESVTNSDLWDAFFLSRARKN